MNPTARIETFERLKEAAENISFHLINKPGRRGQKYAHGVLVELDDDVLRKSLRIFFHTRKSKLNDDPLWTNDDLRICLYVAHSTVVTSISDVNDAMRMDDVCQAYNSLHIYHRLIWYSIFIYFADYLKMEIENPFGMEGKEFLGWLSNAKEAFSHDQENFIAEWNEFMIHYNISRVAGSPFDDAFN